MKNKKLIEIYKSNPCRYHASALWKTIRKPNIKTAIAEDENGIKTIKLYDDKNLYLYFDRENSIPNNIDKYELILLHHSQIRNKYNDAQKYFRLIFNNKKAYKVNQMDYLVKDVDIDKEANKASEFINRCYKDISQSKEQVLSWTKHPVFCEKLWIWIKDSATGEYMGLGIAEYDKDINEGSLEWIQVLPEHRGKGVGKVIVSELINRMRQADFITVSGKADTKAEKLYRSCGFTGDDVWYVIRK